jgi:hypothetical protein
LGRVDIDTALDGLESDVWARIDARARCRASASASSAVAGVCAFVFLVSSAIGVSTAAASATAALGPFALDQPYAPATAIAR